MHTTITASELKTGDIVRINAACFWTVAEIETGLKTVKVSYVWHELSTASNAEPGSAVSLPYTHRLTTKLKVIR